jgi:hypothetical protein
MEMIFLILQIPFSATLPAFMAAAPVGLSGMG